MPSVLIVEDYEELREFLRAFLEGSGYDCIGVSSVKEALTWMAYYDRFDLMLVDLVMPGESGAVLVQACKDKGLPAVILTGLHESTFRSLACSDTPVLYKPVHPDVLATTVRQTLKSTKPTQQVS